MGVHLQVGLPLLQKQEGALLQGPVRIQAGGEQQARLPGSAGGRGTLRFQEHHSIRATALQVVRHGEAEKSSPHD